MAPKVCLVIMPAAAKNAYADWPPQHGRNSKLGGGIYIGTHRRITECKVNALEVVDHFVDQDPEFRPCWLTKDRLGSAA